jgi:chromosome segregation ATPase
MIAEKKKKRAATEETETGVGTVALLASILANLKQYGDKEELKRSIKALHQLVQDWQFAYSSIDAQLSLALRTNEEQNRLIASLREQLRRAQARANESERRLLDLEGERARASSKKREGGSRPGAEP